MVRETEKPGKSPRKCFKPEAHSRNHTLLCTQIHRAAAVGGASCVLSRLPNMLSSLGGQVEQLVGTTRKREGPEDKTWGSSFAKGAFPAISWWKQQLARRKHSKSSEAPSGRGRGRGRGGCPQSGCSTRPTLRLPHTLFFMYLFNTCFGGTYSIL